MEKSAYNVVYRTKKDDGFRLVHAHGEHVYTEEGVRLAFIWYDDEGRYVEAGKAFESKLNESFTEALHKGSLYRKNYYDQLTGLPCMIYFFDLANAGKQRLLKQGKKPVLLYLQYLPMRKIWKKR